MVGKASSCAVGGHQIAYHRAGSGDVVLLVHGISTYSFLWRNVMSTLAKSYDVIALDLLGCGDSDKPLDVSYGLSAHADRLAELAAALHIERLHLVGHDLGGGISQLVAVRRPELVQTLTLVNTVGYSFWPVQPITTLRAPVVRQLLMASLDLGALKLIVRRGIHHRERITPELMSLFKRPLETKAGRKALLHFARCLDNHELTSITDKLAELPMPTLIVRGDADVYLSASIAEQLHDAIPDSQLARIATAGHYIQEDEPAWLAATITDFLRERNGKH